VIDAQKRLGIDQDDIQILSIGTGHSKTMYGTSTSRSLQSQSALNYLNLMLRTERIKRIDFESDLPLPLDGVSKIDDLITRADHDFTHESEAIRQFILNGGQQ